MPSNSNPEEIPAKYDHTRDGRTPPEQEDDIKRKTDATEDGHRARGDETTAKRARSHGDATAKAAKQRGKKGGW